MLSHDAMCFVDWFPRSVMDTSSDWRWTYISETVLPALRTHGISEDDITRMLVVNPRSILEGGPRTDGGATQVMPANRTDSP